MIMRDGRNEEGEVAKFVRRWGEIESYSDSLIGLSLADRLALCERHEPGTLERTLKELGPMAPELLCWDPDFWLRPKQRFPREPWRILLYLAGRGSGKTLSASEWIVDRIERGEAREIVLVGPNEKDIDQYMLGGYKRRVDGSVGAAALFDVIPPWMRYIRKIEDRLIIFPDYSATIRLHSAEIPEFRGPNPDTIWGDEIRKWRFPKRLLDNLLLACRAISTDMPRVLLTSSPSKGLRLFRDLVSGEYAEDTLVITGDTKENRGNVDERWYTGQERQLRGTSQGQEELGGKILLEDEGAKFSLGQIDMHRVDVGPSYYDVIAIGVDPAGSKRHYSDRTGIVCVGRSGTKTEGHGYVLEDQTEKYSPDQWAGVVFELAERHGASVICAERNKFGDYIPTMLRLVAPQRGYRVESTSKGLVFVAPSHKRIALIEVLAMGDKGQRADPLTTLYAKGRMHHVGRLPDLEDEMTTWDPSEGSQSPNSLDALVHACAELFGLDSRPQQAPSVDPKQLSEANAQLDKARSPSAHKTVGWISAKGSYRRGGI